MSVGPAADHVSDIPREPPILRSQPTTNSASLAAGLAANDPLAAADPAAIRVVRAPGRVNLIGEHTDYNDGLVLPIAVDLAISIALVPTDDRRVVVRLAATGETAGVDLDAIGPPTGGWIDYLAGTALALADAGLPTRGFRGLLASDLPQGTGLASSAALELASAFALSGGEEPPTDRLTLARICQRAENEYVGVACGLMDQAASSLAREETALLLDCRSLEFRFVPVALPDTTLVVCDSGSPRRLGASAYNERRAQCAAAVAGVAAAHPGVRSLRDVSVAMLDEVSARLDPVLARRARHVVEENARVDAAAAALEARDAVRLGRLFSASHASLRDRYEVSSPELDALVDIAEAVPGVLGARLTGAGFGGCTVALVRREGVERLVDAVHGQYPARTGLTPRVFEVTPAGGAAVVDADA